VSPLRNGRIQITYAAEKVSERIFLAEMEIAKPASVDKESRGLMSTPKVPATVKSKAPAVTHATLTAVISCRSGSWMKMPMTFRLASLIDPITLYAAFTSAPPARLAKTTSLGGLAGLEPSTGAVSLASNVASAPCGDSAAACLGALPPEFNVASAPWGDSSAA
jgi:hypothetical protein